MAYNQQQPNVAWYDSGSATSEASAYGGGGATTRGGDARHRPTAATFAPQAPAFVPPPQASFDSFDAAAGGPSTSGYGYGSGGVNDRGPTGPGGGFEDEPPLLEELGIDLSGIVRRSAAVLSGRASAAVGGAAGGASSSPGGDDGPDLGGPLLFLAALGATHLLASKLHFGVILGWTVVGSFASWVVAGNLAAAASAAASDPSSAAASSPPHGSGVPPSSATSAAPLPPAVRVGLYETTCLVGYGMLPLVLASALALLLPAAAASSPGGGSSAGAARAALVGGAALWSGRCASGLFAARWPALRRSSGLVAYPCAMLYCSLALLTLYSRNGGSGISGGGGAATTTVTTLPLVPPPPPPPSLVTPSPPVLTT